MMTTTITMRITIRCFLIPVCDDTAPDALPGRRRLQGFDDLPHGKPPLRCSVSRCKVVITIIIIITTIMINFVKHHHLPQGVHGPDHHRHHDNCDHLHCHDHRYDNHDFNFFEISQSYFNVFSAVSYDEQNARVSVVYNDHSLYIWDVRDIRKVGVFGFPSYYVKKLTMYL